MVSNQLVLGEFHISVGTNQSPENGFSAKEKLTLGITLLIWSITNAILVASTYVLTSFSPFVIYLMLTSVVLFPPIGAYLVSSVVSEQKQ